MIMFGPTCPPLGPGVSICALYQVNPLLVVQPIQRSVLVGLFAGGWPATYQVSSGAKPIVFHSMFGTVGAAVGMDVKVELLLIA